VRGRMFVVLFVLAFLFRMAIAARDFRRAGDAPLRNRKRGAHLLCGCIDVNEEFRGLFPSYARPL
jgi:hypothetical protein